jgi:hypothetical protein
MFNLHLFLSLTIITLLINSIVSPPVDPNEKKKEDVEGSNSDNNPIHDLEYSRYLKEVVSVLESDPKFKQMIENASVDDIKSGKIASHLDLVGHHVRTQLDELKRKEIERLSELIQKKVQMENIQPHEIAGILPKHIDNHQAPFSQTDLEKLVKQASADLEDLDKKRKTEFKDHELEKEYERREQLSKMDEVHRKQAEEEHKRVLEEQKHHAKINHPGSEDQLEEVWEKQDELSGAEFDPKTFFKLHDTNDDGFWDEFEIEALFQIELDKVYNASNSNFDSQEREEEMNRMREHVMNEIDKDKDRMVSLQEFIASTQQSEFKQNEEWKSVEDEPQFNEQEFENFSKLHESTNAPPPTPIH